MIQTSNRTIHASGLAARLDAVLASSKDEADVFEQHDKIRDAVERSYRKAVDAFVDKAADACKEKRAKRKREMNLLFFVLFEEEEEDAWEMAHDRLSKLLPSRGGLPGQTAKDFAVGRAKLLKDFPGSVVDRLDQAIADAEQGDPKARTGAIRKAAQEVKDGAGQRVAATEAQATYGSAQLAALKRAGFTHKAWTTVGDEKVRDSHNLCEEQGAIPLAAKFHNGLEFPGDPRGGPEECINCRCWLTGAGKARR